MLTVAVVGKMGSGKTTLADEISKTVFSGRAARASFASPIKEIYVKSADFVYYPFEMLGENEMDSEKYRELIRMTAELRTLDSRAASGDKPRRQYQLIGDTYKRLFGNDFFAKKLFLDFAQEMGIHLACGAARPAALVIDDCRFSVEYDACVDMSPECLFVYTHLQEEARREVADRLGLVPSASSHKSETEPELLLSRMMETGKISSVETVSGERVLHFLYFRDRECVESICSTEATDLVAEISLASARLSGQLPESRA
jgi:hypothetical protein